MKLLISRKQERDSSSGVKFVVHFKLELSQKEIELVKRYDYPENVLGFTEHYWAGTTIEELTSGVEVKHHDVRGILAIEKNVVNDCGAVCNYWKAAEEYKGDQELYIDSYFE